MNITQLYEQIIQDYYKFGWSVQHKHMNFILQTPFINNVAGELDTKTRT